MAYLAAFKAKYGKLYPEAVRSLSEEEDKTLTFCQPVQQLRIRGDVIFSILLDLELTLPLQKSYTHPVKKSKPCLGTFLPLVNQTHKREKRSW